MEISHAKAKELWGQLQRIRDGAKRNRENTEKKIGEVKCAVEAVAGSALAGFANGYLGKNGMPVQIFGLDADMVAGLGLALVGISGVAGKYSEDSTALGAGLFGGFAYRSADFLGAKMASNGQITTQAQVHAVKAQAAGYMVSAGQYTGARPAGQYTGAIPAGQYR